MQLYALMAYGRDFEENTEDFGIFVHEANLSGVTWVSSNNEIATVDNSGKVTGVSAGIATITATYNENSVDYEVTVLQRNSNNDSGISFYYDEPGPAMLLNSEEKFSVGLENIPKSEKENITFRIENENIAIITKTEYDTTISKTTLSKAGKNALIVIGIISAVLISLIIYIKYKNYKNVK